MLLARDMYESRLKIRSNFRGEKSSPKRCQIFHEAKDARYAATISFFLSFFLVFIGFVLILIFSTAMSGFISVTFWIASANACEKKLLALN